MEIPYGSCFVGPTVFHARIFARRKVFEAGCVKDKVSQVNGSGVLFLSLFFQFSQFF